MKQGGFVWDLSMVSQLYLGDLDNQFCFSVIWKGKLTNELFVVSINCRDENCSIKFYEGIF